MKYDHKITEPTVYDVKSMNPNESWMIDVPEEALPFVRLVRVPKHVPSTV